MDLKVTDLRIRPSGDYSRKTRVYVNIVGETLWDNLAERRSRPYNAFRPVVEAALKEHDIEFEKMSWSQKAGCSCPCSPGFILTGSYGKEIWVDVEGYEPQTDYDREAIAEQVMHGIRVVLR